MPESEPKERMSRSAWLELASRYYAMAKKERAQMVRLAPQYRKKDRFNAEREYLDSIVTFMGIYRICLAAAAQEKEEG